MMPAQTGGEQRPRPRTEDSAELAALWWALVSRLATRLTHEIRNPLNGAMVNLQVIASRAERSGADAAALAPFATSAGTELDRATGMVEALLHLLRLPAAPEDLSTSVLAVGSVYATAALRTGGTLLVRGERSNVGAPAASALAVRTALALALDSAVADGGEVDVTIDDQQELVVRVRRGEGLRELDAASVATLSDAGIAAEHASNEYILHFPAVSGRTPRRT